MADLIFKHPEYTNTRPKILGQYVKQVHNYLKTQYPNQSDETIAAFVQNIIKDRMEIPQIKIIRHPEPGSSVIETLPLSEHAAKNIKQNILSPSGTCYISPAIKPSFLKTVLKKKVAERKAYKKIWLESLEIGDETKADEFNWKQSSTKIFANSAPGAMGSPFNIISDLAGFNAITSISRHSVKSGYAHVERLVCGNVFLPTMDAVIHYCENHRGVMPAHFDQTMKQFGLHYPSSDVVADFFIDSLKYYTYIQDRAFLIRYLDRIPDDEKSFIFYANNFHNLIHHNDTVMRRVFETLFDTNLTPLPFDESVKIVESAESALLAMITSLNYELFGFNEDGGRNNIHDVLKNKLECVTQVAAIVQHMQQHLQHHAALWSDLFRVDVDLSYITKYQAMIRKCVIISDTDSVIFTTQPVVEWYSGELNFSRQSYEINAFTVYLISKSLEHVFGRLSSQLGMAKEDIGKISMKNEFLYPIMLRTPVSKHYAGIVQMQEGKLLAKPKDDIKGVQFRDSSFPKRVVKSTEQFLISTLTEVMNGEKLKASDVLMKVAKFESDIYHSVMNGEKEFLKTLSIKHQKNYRNENQTQFLSYQFWTDVFTPRYDTIILPNKCPAIPILEKGKAVLNPLFLERLQGENSELPERIKDFMDRYNKKEMTKLVFAPSLPTIPEVLRPIIDVRKIIFQCASPFYLGLTSMGFSYQFRKNLFLVTDFFNPFEINVPYS